MYMYRLDIESITGVAGNVEAEFWGFSGHSPDDKDNEPFFKWLSVVANTTDDEVPKIFSTSYGEDEDTWSDCTCRFLLPPSSSPPPCFDIVVLLMMTMVLDELVVM